MLNPNEILKAGILIVDDKEANVSLLEQMLRGAGYVDISSTRDSRAVGELHRQHHYDLILLDLQMPGLDGFQVMEELKIIEPGGDLPVLVITVQPDHKLRALQAGAKDFISKPFDLAEVLARVRNLIEVRLLHRNEADLTRARLERSQRLAGLGDWDYDFAEHRLFWSDELYRILGLERTDFPPDSATFYRHVHPDDLAVVHREKKAAAAGSRRVDFEHRIIRADGEVRHVHQITAMTFDTAGQPLRESGTIQDITERKLAEASLHQSETRFAAAFEQAPIGMALVSPEGRWLKVNRALCDLVGYLEPELLARTFQEITHPDDLAGDLEQNRRVIAGEIRSYQLENRYVHARGHLVTVLLNVSLIRDGENQPLYFIAQIQDITERKRAEKVVQSERDFSDASLNSLPGIFYVFDQAGKFLRWNRNFEHVSGYSADELALRHPLDFFSGKDRVHIAGKLTEVFAAGAATAEAYFTAKDGTRTPYYLTGHRLELDGRPCLIGTGIDLTERKTLEARSIEAQKTEVIGQLAAGVAHDFNNILAVILGYSELMMQALGADDPLRRHAGEIRHAAERAVGLTRQLLVFSHKETVLPVVLDYNEVVNEMDQMLRRLIGEHIEMTITLDSRIGRIRADSGYVGQVLMNLVVNARDAMPGGGKLTIATSNVTVGESQASSHPGAMPGDYVMLSVRDTGTGMTAEVKARLFEAFFTTKPKGKGTGLGLATCQTIVHQSGGFIDVHSELGQGATFKVYFPRVDQPIVVKTATSPPWLLPRGTETLLVVEDEAAVRHLAREVLENQGYRVLRACNGQEGLRVVRDNDGPPVRLVVTDLIMPVMGGKVMAEWLKTTYPETKILFTSGYTDEAITRNGIFENGMEFLAKPYTPAALTRRVRELLDSPGVPAR